MSRPPTRWRAAVALVAAYALILQAFFAALAPGAQADPSALDAAHVLCLPSGAPDGPAAPAAPGVRHDGCCVLCAPAAPGVPPAPAAIAGPGYVSSAPLLPTAAAPVRAASGRSPFDPRAPPA